MPFNKERAASIKDSLLDMLLGDPSTRHVRPKSHRKPNVTENDLQSASHF